MGIDALSQWFTPEEQRALIFFYPYIFTMLSAIGEYAETKKYLDSLGTPYDIYINPDKNETGDVIAAVNGARMCGQAVMGGLFLILYILEA